MSNEREFEVTRRSWEVNCKEATAVIIRCFDRRFRIAHAGFIKDVLRLDGNDFWPIKCAGGAGPIARPQEMAHDYEKIMSDLLTAVNTGKITHVILLTHQDCHRYKPIRTANSGNVEEADAKKAAEEIARLFPNIEVSAFFAYLTEDKQIRFKVVKPCSLAAKDELILNTCF